MTKTLNAAELEIVCGGRTLVVAGDKYEDADSQSGSGNSGDMTQNPAANPDRPDSIF